MVQFVEALPAAPPYARGWICANTRTVAGKNGSPRTRAVKGAPQFDAIADEFLAFIGDSPIVAHNASFDLGMINAELKRIGRKPMRNQVIDTLALARKQHSGAVATLDALCNRFKIDRSKRTRHGAMLDCELLANVYTALTGGRQRDMFGPVKPVRDIVKLSIGPRTRTPRAVTIAFDDAAAHRAFMASIKDSVWSHVG